MLEIYLLDPKTVLQLPLYSDKISAGFPSPASDYQEEKIDLNEALIRHPSSTYLVRAQGDSMIGTGIFDHDLLVVDRSLIPRNGSIAIAVVHGDLTVKRLRIRNENGHGRMMVLAAENPDYPDIHVQSEDSVIWGGLLCGA